jgi:hypothetical protein
MTLDVFNFFPIYGYWEKWVFRLDRMQRYRCRDLVIKHGPAARRNQGKIFPCLKQTRISRFLEDNDKIITRLTRLLVRYNDKMLRLMTTSIVITGDRTLLLSRHCEGLPWSDGGLPHVQWSQWSNSRGQRDLRYTPFLRWRSLGE